MSIQTAAKNFSDRPSALVESAEQQLARAIDASGEGSRVFLSLDETKIREQTAASVSRFESKSARALEGITISIKDLFDVKDEVT
ncbi:MAG: amidase, partial [Casimicrobium sp.]